MVSTTTTNGEQKNNRRKVGLKGGESTPYPGETLLVPIVSTGNVGQLTVDLLISTFRDDTAVPGSSRNEHGFNDDDAALVVSPFAFNDDTRVIINSNSTGSTVQLHSPYVIPTCGYEAFPDSPCRLVTALELYHVIPGQVSAIQQRSPIILSPKAEEAFVLDLLVWAKERGFKEILLLSGCDASGGVSVSGDVIPGGTALCQMLGFSDNDEVPAAASAVPDNAYEKLRACGVPELRREEIQNVKSDQEEVLNSMGLSSFNSQTLLPEAMESLHDARIIPPKQFTPGMGVCRFFAGVCTSSSMSRSSLPVSVAVMPCSDGNNAGDAESLAKTICTALELRPGLKLKRPLSWNFLFASPPVDQGMLPSRINELPGIEWRRFAKCFKNAQVIEEQCNHTSRSVFTIPVFD